jgi:hypothetical protein
MRKNVYPGVYKTPLPTLSSPKGITSQPSGAKPKPAVPTKGGSGIPESAPAPNSAPAGFKPIASKGTPRK